MLNYLESLESDDEDVDKVYLEPPNYSQVSDEDSGDEDCGGTVDNLSRKQLQAPCELVCNANDDDIPVDDSVNSADDDIANLIRDVLQNSFENITTDLLTDAPGQSSSSPNLQTSFPEVEPTTHAFNKTPEKISVRKKDRKRQNISKKNGPRAKIHKETELVWVESNTSTSKPLFPDPNYTDCSGLLPHQQFEKFIDDEVVQMLCDETNAYSVQLEGQNPKITVNEMKVFIGIMIVTGYTSRPKKRDYWCEDPDMLCPMVSESMRRNRFEIIFRYMHFKDNSLEDREDKIWKIRPITDAVKKRCLSNFHPEQDLSYDESMVEYYGRHGCKQFIRGKPLRFGYKMWCLNTPLGYLINFEMYQGTNPRIRPLYPELYGKNSAPLFSMLDDLDDEKRHMPYCISFDILFTSTRVLLGLKQRGYHGTGTIREIMIPKSCPLPDKKALKKKQRGHIESIKLEGANIYVTKWIDNAVVSVASTI